VQPADRDGRVIVDYLTYLDHRSTESQDDAGARARAWNHDRLTSVCDVLEPWAHGTVARATRYPNYFHYNLVRVEDDPGMSAQELEAFADEALAGLVHRRLDFDLVEVADSLRPDFEASGWRATRLLFMRHEVGSKPAGAAAVEEVPYDVADDLRMAWHREDPREEDPTAFHAQAREVALLRGARILVAKDDRSVPIAFAQLEQDGMTAEIAQVYVHPDHRGRGLGTAVTQAAIGAAGSVRDLWIAADDEDRAKDLYARLGFRSAWATMEVERPKAGS
jgi:ribosomal protein S18 acetylase RimI-like enzyme